MTTFAGRRDRMSILMTYVLKALRCGLIDEHHVWNYARNRRDRAWVSSLSAYHPGIRVMEPRGRPFDAYYDHYRKEDYGDAVFLKADDDIVYIDLERLPGFIAHRISDPATFLLSANVVNNGVCAYFQQQRGVLPATFPTLPYPPGGICGLLWERADLAVQLHRAFLDAPRSFGFPGTTLAPDRLSINFVSYLGRDLDLIEGLRGDDEDMLSVKLPRASGRSNLIHNPFVVSHLSFYSQDQGMDRESLLQAYAELLEPSIQRRDHRSLAGKIPLENRAYLRRVRRFLSRS
jgi:hypothetical protein